MATLTNNLGATISLGTIQDEDSTKDAQLFQQPMPVTDSNGLIALDLFGCMRTLNLKGVYTSADGTISTFCQNLDALANGNQVLKTYSSDVSGTSYSVYVQTVRWSRSQGEVNSVNWEISLLEAAA